MFRSSPQLMWDLTLHTPSRLNILASTRSLFKSMWDLPIHPPPPFEAQRPCWHTALCPPPFKAQPPRWHIAQCLPLIPFITIQVHRSQLFVVVGLPLKVFKMCMLKKGFHALIKNISFYSPTDVRSHTRMPIMRMPIMNCLELV